MNKKVIIYVLVVLVIFLAGFSIFRPSKPVPIIGNDFNPLPYIPFIHDINPTSVVAGGTVNIFGNFGDNAHVIIDGKYSSIERHNSFVVPTNISSGRHYVQIQNVGVSDLPDLSNKVLLIVIP
jgi:hypothetical protein